MTEPEAAGPEIDTTVAHVARVYDYLLGGKANFAADREAAARAYASWPGGLDGVRADVQAHRAVLGRMVRYLVGDVGIRQFLDLGSGIPKQNNVHEVAQQAAPEARVVYVDNDPVALAHAHSMLRGAPEGKVAYLCQDMREPDTILTEAADTLDFTRPTAVIMFGVPHLFTDADNPRGLVTRLMAAVPSGSHLALSHLADTTELRATFDALNQQMAEQVTLRTRDGVAELLADLDPVEPGVVELPQWRPDENAGEAGPLPTWCGLARKP